MEKYPKVESFCKMIKKIELKEDKTDFLFVLEPKLDGSNIRYNGEIFGSRNVEPIPPELENMMRSYFDIYQLKQYLEMFREDGVVYFEMITPKNSVVHRKDLLIDIVPFERFKNGRFEPFLWSHRTFKNRIVKKIILTAIDYWDLIYELQNIYKLNWFEFGKIEGVVIKLVKDGKVIHRFKFKPFLKVIEGRANLNFDIYEYINDLVKFVNEFQGDILKTKQVVQFWKSFSEFPYFHYIVNYTYTIKKKIPELFIFWLGFVESLYEFLIEHL